MKGGHAAASPIIPAACQDTSGLEGYARDVRLATVVDVYVFTWTERK